MVAPPSHIGGERITGDRRPSQQFGTGRVCADDGCDTRLSLYNDGEWCALHAPMEVPRMRGKVLEA
jgi:hypothetical protein